MNFGPCLDDQTTKELDRVTKELAEAVPTGLPQEQSLFR